MVEDGPTLPLAELLPKKVQVFHAQEALVADATAPFPSRGVAHESAV